MCFAVFMWRVPTHHPFISMYRDVAGAEMQLQDPAPDTAEVSGRNPLLQWGTVSPKGLSFHAICQNTIQGGGMKSFSHQKGCKH